MDNEYRDDSIRYGYFSKRYIRKFGNRSMGVIPYWAMLRMWGLTWKRECYS